MVAAEGSRPQASAAFQAALAQCLLLSDEERGILIATLGAGASLRAWCDGTEQGEPEPENSSPVPHQISYPARAWWPKATDKAGCARLENAVTGCPWCRRPVAVVGCVISPTKEREGFSTVEPERIPQSLVASSNGTGAYVTLLYGPSCHEYFLGALVLGHGLLKHGGSSGSTSPPLVDRVLLYTPDVPEVYLQALEMVGWTNKRVEYLSGVSRSYFHNWKTSRFVDVFTKLRALQLTQYRKIMLLDLDLLIRHPRVAGGNLQPLESVFDLDTPAAMKRGPPVPKHGETVSYAEMWGHSTRRTGDSLPFHQQASGINAGVMLLEPDAKVFALMEKELRDWYHPEHYPTYMPEQEYLSRFYGTFSRWTHVSCCYNFEIDKNERVPHDFTEAHEALRSKDTAMRSEGARAASHPGAIVLHYSGLSVKPWKLVWEYCERGCERKPSLLATAVEGLRPLRDIYSKEGSDGARLDGYADRERLFAAMKEWLDQFVEVSEELREKGVDVLQLVHERELADITAAAAAAEHKRTAENGQWSWERSNWARN